MSDPNQYPPPPGEQPPPPSGYPPPPQGGYPPPPQGGYPPPYGYPAPGHGYGYGPANDHPQGVTILVLGILGIVLLFGCPVVNLAVSIPAWVMGKKALDESRTRHYSNEGQIKAGYICGIIGTVLTIVGIVGFFGLFAFSGMAVLAGA